MPSAPWHRKASAKTQVSLTRFLQSGVKLIHIIVQDQDGQNNNNITQIDQLNLKSNLMKYGYQIKLKPIKK